MPEDSEQLNQIINILGNNLLYTVHLPETHYEGADDEVTEYMRRNFNIVKFVRKKKRISIKCAANVIQASGYWRRLAYEKFSAFTTV